MIELYATLVKAGRRTIEEVPARYRAEVQAMVDAELAD